MANTAGLEFAARTDTGLIRAQNEDSVAVSPEYGFAVLADGMGGYNAGEIASGIATSITKQVLEEGIKRLQHHKLEPRSQRHKQLHQLVVDALQQANTEILRAADAEPEYNGMGTTVVTTLFQNDKVIIAHVGDSRAYRLRQGEFTQITRDHSLLQEQIDAGLITPEWAQYSQHRNLVTRAVGILPDMDVEVREHHVEAGDIYLLCSDGLSDMLLIEEIREVLTQHQSSLNDACESLIQKANEKGGHDNISVILIRVQSTGPENSSLLGRILSWVK